MATIEAGAMPDDMKQLLDAYNQVSDKHDNAVVLNAALYMAAQAIKNIIGGKGGVLAEALVFTDDTAALALRTILIQGWDAVPDHAGPEGLIYGLN